MSATVDVLITGGTVIDGTGAAPVRSDVAIRDDRIVAVGTNLETTPRRTLDARGRAITPGFIDAHTHDDRALLSDPTHAPKVSQGVTTLIAGNCGVSLAPLALEGQPPPPLDLLGPDPGWFRFPRFGDYVKALEQEPPAVNCGLLVGHITLRHGTMDRFDRPATATETAAMAERIDEAMEAGAIGFSTGLDYPPAVEASYAEVLTLVKAVRPHGGIYCSHHRNYFERLEEALAEVFRLSEDAGVPTVISHHQATGASNFGKGPKTLAMISQARRQTPIGLDIYPYNASSKTLDPGRARPGVKIMVTWSTPCPHCAGRMLEDVAAEWGVSAPAAAERLLPAGAIYFQLDEQDVRSILAYPHAMIGSDGLPHDVHPHPRLWGTFPRVLGHYVRDLGLFTLEEAVRRMTSLPAAWFGFRDRGVIRPGAFADLVILDPDTVRDTATFTDPARPAAGIDTVMCNGRITWSDGASTGARPGRVLRREPEVAVTAPDP